jgi:hypothetical protein
MIIIIIRRIIISRCNQTSPDQHVTVKQLSSQTSRTNQPIYYIQLSNQLANKANHTLSVPCVHHVLPIPYSSRLQDHDIGAEQAYNLWSTSTPCYLPSLRPYTGLPLFSTLNSKTFSLCHRPSNVVSESLKLQFLIPEASQSNLLRRQGTLTEVCSNFPQSLQGNSVIVIKP